MNTGRVVLVAGVVALIVAGIVAVVLGGNQTGEMGPSYTGLTSISSRSNPAVLARSYSTGPGLKVEMGATPTTVFEVNATQVAVQNRAVALPTSVIDASEIANISRIVPLPLRAWWECDTNAGADLGWGESVDALPDFINSSTDGLGMAIVFDDTGASPDVNSSICTDFVVPPDYASGGSIVLRASKDAHAGTAEWLNAQVSINGAALGTNAGALTSASALTTYTLTPGGTYAAGNTVGATVVLTSTGTIDDAVSILGASWTYTATQ